MLDEPVSALDPIGRREVLELLETLKQEATILFSTHILNDAEEICDQILVLHNGVIVESGSMEELRERYQQSKIDLVFHGQADIYREAFKAYKWMQSFHAEENRVSIFVDNIEQARQELLQDIAKNKWPLIRFEVSRLTLEDVFMKVVKE